MKITSKILSIPPYVSTPWKNVTSLHVEEENGRYKLVVLLTNRAQIEVPSLDKPTIDVIFEAHAKYAEGEGESSTPMDPMGIKLPFKLGDDPMESFTSAMQHNQAQAGMPDLPPELLDKITGIAKVLGVENIEQLPKAEPHCNCVYCQVARAIHGEERVVAQEGGVEEVSDDDLRFRNWDIKQTAEKLYLVTNPLDANEHYSVFLGEPLGCTCGNKNCEHIRAVLNS